MTTVGVDVGGTKVLAATVAEDGSVGDPVRRPTPGGDHRDLARVIAGVVREVADDVTAVGVGVAGWVSTDRATVLHAPNLTWSGGDLRAAVRAELDVPVVIENDANAAAWAELRFGAAVGETEVVVLTVGTGVGGGLVLGGELRRGAFGVAGEPGHLVVVPDGRECPCGRRGCWEQYASGRALLRRAQELAPDAGWTEGPAVTQAAQGGDERALAAMAEVGRWLGIGMVAVATLLDPAMIVVGGGAGEAGELLLEPARATFRELLPGSEVRPLARIVAAELGNTAGLVGAGDLARRER